MTPAPAVADDAPSARPASRADWMALVADAESAASDVEKTDVTLSATLPDTLADTLFDTPAMAAATTSGGGGGGGGGALSLSSPSLSASISSSVAWRLRKRKLSGEVVVVRRGVSVVESGATSWYRNSKLSPSPSLCVVVHLRTVGPSLVSFCTLLSDANIFGAVPLTPMLPVEQSDHSNKSETPDLIIVRYYHTHGAILRMGFG